MRRLLAVAATITAVTVPSVPGSVASGSTPQTRESQTVHSSSAERDAVAITVYNQNFGLVREARTLHLTRGRVDVEYADVASGIQPETVHIRPRVHGHRYHVRLPSHAGRGIPLPAPSPPIRASRQPIPAH